MGNSRIVRGFLGLCAVAFLAGCGVAQRPAFGPTVTSDASAPRAARSLIYVSNEPGLVTVFALPSLKLVQTLRHGFGTLTGLCSDSRGDVFITDLNYEHIVEFEHGGTRHIQVLKLPRGSFSPEGCAYDPITGNLAVTISNGVAIYPQAKGTPTIYKAPNIYRYYHCTFDDAGNLYVDGGGGSRSVQFEFAELPRGGTSFVAVKLSQKIGDAGGVQWDGKYVVVGDYDKSIVYRFSINGSTGTKVGSTRMSGASHVQQFWIGSNQLMAPSLHHSRSQYVSKVLIYNYPAGGTATAVLNGDVYYPTAVTVSVPPP